VLQTCNKPRIYGPSGRYLRLLYKKAGILNHETLVHDYFVIQLRTLMQTQDVTNISSENNFEGKPWHAWIPIFQFWAPLVSVSHRI